MRGLKKIIGVFVFIFASVLLIPNVFAEEDYIDKILTDGKLVIPSVPPTSDHQYYMMVDEWIDATYGRNYSGQLEGVINCNETYTRCTIYYDSSYWDEELQEHIEGVKQSKEVDFVYDYDKNVKKVVDNIVSNFPEERTFHLTDMEYLSYLIYALGSEDADEESAPSISAFSGELRRFINYKNFDIDVRMGADEIFYTLRAGASKITYDGTIYYLGGIFGVDAKHVIYVPDDTTDIVKAVKDRIKNVFGNVNVDVTLDDYTIDDLISDEYDYYYDEFNSLLEEYNQYGWNEYYITTYGTAENYANTMIANTYGEESDQAFLAEAERNILSLTINDSIVTGVVVIKDSSKVDDTISFKSSDVRTDISIETSSQLPLDTLIKASKLTSGEEYNRIIKVLNSDNSVTYDLELYSGSLGDNVTKVDGKFIVTIPIPEELKGKDFTVYYVKADGTKEEHKITKKTDDYIQFETDHLSTYTLVTSTDNPNTLDSVIKYVIIAIVGLIGIVGVGLICIKSKKKN